MVKVRAHSWGGTLRRLFSKQRSLTMRAFSLAIFAALLVLAPQAARAQAALEPTQIVVGAPAQADLGTPLTVQALLTDSQGHPISKALIYFAVQDTFLHESSDVVLAQAVTNGNGQAVAQIADDFSGTITLQAEFRGDDQYAPSAATTPIAAASDQQVYSDHVGVNIPGLNVPPVSRSMAAIQSPLANLWGVVQSLWPAMNGWPLAAALLLVWANYAFAVTFVFRLAALGGKSDDSRSGEPRRLL